MVVTVLAGLALLLTGCGAHYDFVIHDNETADLTYIMWDSSGLPLITRESCTEKKLEKSTPLPKNVEANYTYTSHNGHPACQVTAKSVPLNDLQTDVWTIKHQDGKYVFDLSPDALSRLGEDDSRSSSQGAAGGMKVSIAVTFPGEVTKSNGRNDDNKVTWDNVLESPEAPHAEGGDGKFHLQWWMIAAASAAALLLWQLADHANSRRWYELTRELAPVLLRSQYLGEIAQIPAESLTIYCQALQQRIDRNDPQQLATLARCYNRDNQYPIAADIYARARKLAPNDAALALDYAQTSLFAHPDRPMPPDIETILRAQSGQNPLAKILLAAGYTQSGKKNLAAPLWGELRRELAPEHPLSRLTPADSDTPSANTANAPTITVHIHPDTLASLPPTALPYTGWTTATPCTSSATGARTAKSCATPTAHAR